MLSRLYIYTYGLYSIYIYEIKFTQSSSKSIVYPRNGFSH